MVIFRLIQSTLYSPPREIMFTGIVGVVNRYLILVVEASFRRVGFFLFLISNSVSKTKCFKLPSQLPKRYLDKVLIICAPNLNFLLNTWVISNYQFAYLTVKAMVNYYLCGFVQIVSDAVITPLVESCLFICKRLDSLFIFGRLKLSVSLVVELINALKKYCRHSYNATL